jgi:two-component system OmpR family response regulator
MNPITQSMKKRILVVDDKASDTKLLKCYLEENHDYVVCEENDPKAALSTAEKFQPHLILLDVLMPEMDGGELAASFYGESKKKTIII